MISLGCSMQGRHVVAGMLLARQQTASPHLGTTLSSLDGAMAVQRACKAEPNATAEHSNQAPVSQSC
jgi:hypothetical protein